MCERALSTRALLLLGIGLGFLLAAACTGQSASAGPTPLSQPARTQFVAAGLGSLPVAPDGARVDLALPPFSDPTSVTNTLFPISELRSAVLNGRIDGKPFHTETTLLPYTRTIEWAPGQRVETLISQYAAFLDGRIQEVALDYYAQADDGSVWYFGEDVADYDPQGLIAYTTDSWLAGQDGPPAMIMPGHPVLGAVFRTENIPGLVFEQVIVKKIDQTVPGPAGPVDGAMIGEELHDDAATSDKVFAPGYGEFMTRDADGVEAMALAVPTDALSTPMPAVLATLSGQGDRAAAAISAGDWRHAAAEMHVVQSAWDRYARTAQVPPRLAPPIQRALAALRSGIGARDQQAAATAAIDVAQAALDLELRYRPPAEIDLARFDLWTRQLVVDARAQDVTGVTGDLATLEWTRDRFENRLEPVDLTRVNASLVSLREGVVETDFARVGAEGSSLLEAIAGIELTS
jgi:hypothetical protein